VLLVDYQEDFTFRVYSVMLKSQFRLHNFLLWHSGTRVGFPLIKIVCNDDNLTADTKEVLNTLAELRFRLLAF
jgi:hypothetical protein